MASTFLRRSGIAVGLIAELLKWEPTEVYQVGVGMLHKEVEVFQHIWPNATLYGCEPHPDTYKAIKNTYPGDLFNVAMSDQWGTAVLYSNRRHSDGASLHKHAISDSPLREYTVGLDTVDRLFAKTELAPSGPTLLWIDCEGHELNVLNGAQEFMFNYPVDVVNIEMTSKPNGPGRCKPTDIHLLMERRDYYLQWVHTQRSSAGQTDAIYVRSKLFNPEYCCIPHEVLRYESSRP